MTKLADRTHHRLWERDLKMIQTALIRYVMDTELDAAEVDADDYLVTTILPYMAKQSEEWEGVDKVKEWDGSTAYKHVKEYLKNLLRNKGYYLKKKIA